jgi:RNA polymerase sigma factor for flagellar operon FliA
MTEDLWREYRDHRDPALRARLIEMHLPLVRYIASKMLPSLHSSVELQDLVSWGCFGLIDAVERYDPEAGTKFSTFATYRIQGSITDEMRAQAWEPRSVRQKSRAVIAAVADLERQLGRTPSDIEVATHVGCSMDELGRTRLEMDAARVASLSATRDDDGENGGSEFGEIALAATDLGDAGAEYEELSASVASAISRLGRQDRDLLEWVYVQGRPFKEIAAILGVTDSWVSHLHIRGLVRLQRILSARY